MSQEKLMDMLRDASSVMLVTHTPEGQLRARPMALANVDDAGMIWFVTDQHSGKVADLVSNPQVAVTVQQGGDYLSLSGTAMTVDDRQRIADLWSEAWRVWFPKGKTDPSIILLRMRPDSGEYWDSSGLSGLSYLWKAGIAYLQGERPQTDKAIHDKVNL